MVRRLWFDGHGEKVMVRQLFCHGEMARCRCAWVCACMRIFACMHMHVLNVSVKEEKTSWKGVPLW